MITITRDNIYRSPISLKQTEAKSKSVEEVNVADVICFLGEEVEFGEDIIFKNLFDVIIFHKDFFNILYANELKGTLIEDFIDEYESDLRIINNNVDYKLRFSWIADTYDHGTSVELFDYVSFDAFGKLNKKEDKQDYGISVALSSLCEIKHDAVFIDNTYEIKDYSTMENEIDSIFKANVKPITLYDVFGSILVEISKFGTPEDREAVVGEAFGPASRKDDEEIIREHYDEREAVKNDILNMISEDYDKDNNKSFWDVLYPKEEPTGTSSQEAVNNAIIALSEGADIPLEEQLKEAHDNEKYELAAKIKKLIDQRDDKKDE